MDAFRDRIAVITGGASGIGRAMADAFAERGARLVLADIDEASLAQAEKDLVARGATVLAVPTDVTRRESVCALADRAFAHYGHVHVVCNNAGIAVLGPLADATPADWDATMAINFWGVVYGVDSFLPRLIAQAEGGTSSTRRRWRAWSEWRGSGSTAPPSSRWWDSANRCTANVAPTTSA